jgi:hypothetical protein
MGKNPQAARESSPSAGTGPSLDRLPEYPSLPIRDSGLQDEPHRSSTPHLTNH